MLQQRVPKTSRRFASSCRDSCSASTSWSRRTRPSRPRTTNLKAQDDYLKAETKGLRKDAATLHSELGKVKGADWAGRVAVKGDLRYRYEVISDETLNCGGVQNTADRYRDRIRARVNVEAKATDTILSGSA